MPKMFTEDGYLFFARLNFYKKDALVQLFVFLFLCLVWGTTWAAIKISLMGLPPFLGSGIRFMVALLLLLAFVLIRRISLRVDRRSFKILFFSALLMYVLDYGLIYWAEQYLSAGVTAIFFATFPLFTGLWSNFLFRNETFRWNKFLGLVLGFTGIILVFLDQLLLTQFSTRVIFGALAVIVGAAGGAMSVVMIKKYLSMINPISLSLHQMMWGALCLLAIGFVSEVPATINLSPKIISAVLYLGAIGSALAFALYFWLLQRMSAISISLIIYITPVIAVIVDYFLFGEIIQFRTIAGMVIIFSGIALTQTGYRKSSAFSG